MKKTSKFLNFIFTTIIAINSAIFNVHAQDLKININGTILDTKETQAFIENGRIMVPVRVISENLGATVNYTKESSIIQIIKGGDRIVMRIGENWAIVNLVGISTTKRILDTKVKIKNDRAYVPVRFISEIFNSRVTWDQNTYTVLINPIKTKSVSESVYN